MGCSEVNSTDGGGVKVKAVDLALINLAKIGFGAVCLIMVKFIQ